MDDTPQPHAAGLSYPAQCVTDSLRGGVPLKGFASLDTMWNAAISTMVDTEPLWCATCRPEAAINKHIARPIVWHHGTDNQVLLCWRERLAQDDDAASSVAHPGEQEHLGPARPVLPDRSGNG